MKRIDSASNQRIKALVRRIQKSDFRSHWWVEGKTLFLDAVSSGIEFSEIYLTRGMSQQLKEMLARLPAGPEIFEVSPAVMKAISTLETPPGIVGLSVQQQEEASKEIRAFAALLLSVRDPGNLGAIVRAAEAAGCEFVACSPDCADPRQPKVVRGSMGSIFRVPVFKIPESRLYVEELQRRGVHIYALSPRDGLSLYELRPKFPALVVLGGEARGVPSSFPAEQHITIPMRGRVESLNTAIAGALCFYRFHEQGSGK